VIPSNEARKMTMSKMALLGVAVVAAVVIGSGTLAWVHNGAATADHENATHYVVGPDGRLIGAAPNPSIRSQWEREGLPN
jgi:tryptophan synthase beta subunit